jgi:hypothetical protein
MPDNQSNYTRRKTLRNIGITAGGLTLGSAALGGSAVAMKQGGTGFVIPQGIHESPFKLQEQDVYENISVECEEDGELREIYTAMAVRYLDPNLRAPLLWIKGAATPSTDVTYEFKKVRECGTLFAPNFDGQGNDTSFEVNKATFGPVKL